MVPGTPDAPKKNSSEIDNISPVGPFRVVNIGNSKPVQLLDFICAIEKSIGMSAVKNMLPMQAGDVPITWADATLLQNLTGYKSSTDFTDGVEQFVAWYRNYYGK